MRLLLVTIIKEFKQFFRNHILVVLVVVAPLIVVAITPFAYDGSARFKVAICDLDGDFSSATHYKELSYSPLYKDLLFFTDLESAQKAMDEGKVDFIMVHSKDDPIAFLEGTFAPRSLNAFITTERLLRGDEEGQLSFQILFNIGRKYNHYITFTLVILMVTIVASSLIMLNVVKEKEDGLEEQLEAAKVPLIPYMIGKSFFHILLSLFILYILLLFSHIAFGLRVEGSLICFTLFSLLYFTPLVGLGLIVASFSPTQTRAIYLQTLVLILLVMLSTMFTYLSSMPRWAALTRFVNPLFFGVDGFRQILFRGANIVQLKESLLGLSFLAVLLNGVAYMRFRRG